jgi:hypothetical protein
MKLPRWEDPGTPHTTKFQNRQLLWVHADVQQKHTFGTRTSLTQTQNWTPKPENQAKSFTCKYLV